MTKYHLLWHIFGYLYKNHKAVLEDMLENISDAKWSLEAKHTIRQSLNDAYRDFTPEKE